jgi:hypothetical protein
MISFDKISRGFQGLLQRLSWHNIRFKIIHATCRLSCVHGGNRVLNPRTRLVKYRSSLAFWMLHPRFDYCRCCWRVYQILFLFVTALVSCISSSFHITRSQRCLISRHASPLSSHARQVVLPVRRCRLRDEVSWRQEHWRNDCRGGERKQVQRRDFERSA